MRFPADENLPRDVPDTDFGEIIFRRRQAASGVILLRLSDPPQAQAALVSAVIPTRDDWTDLFTVLTDDRVRVRPLPPAIP